MMVFRLLELSSAFHISYDLIYFKFKITFTLLTQTAVYFVRYDPIGPAKAIVASCSSTCITSNVTININIHPLFISQVYISFKHIIWEWWAGEICKERTVLRRYFQRNVVIRSTVIGPTTTMATTIIL